MHKNVIVILGGVFLGVGALMGVLSAVLYFAIIPRAAAWIFLVVMLPIVLTFGILGACFLLYHSRKMKRHQWLLEYGTAVWANVLGVEENWSIIVNGRPAKVLVASYNNMRFVSGPVDNNDLAQVGEHVKVLIDPDDNNKYTFDFMNESHRMPFEQPAPLNSN